MQGVRGIWKYCVMAGWISGDEFIAVRRLYALGRILFGLSKTKVIAETDIKK